MHTPIGLLERGLNRNAFYQEVYDWLGCYKDLPLYFVLVGQTQNGSDLCYPEDKVAQDGEVLKLLEKDEEGMKTMISSTEVTFCGTFPQLSDLNSTAESPDGSTSQNDGGTSKRRKRRRNKEKERKKQITTEKTE
ncbi:PREDICTED: uncharacterized protein LOC107328178 [Acropora digitifera]|uniref:uncharacterized protein LOC107328178 n=1 Tax=Acropora digitifera TaxID=70779 RepID=UPI000779FE88|nr:PREDICTED: uncharacterized protein LOC107328178 [Acropora digitifera]